MITIHPLDYAMSQEIKAGIRRAIARLFRKFIHGLANPYGDGKASPRIVSKLAEVPLSGRLLEKRFHDLPIPEERR